MAEDIGRDAGGAEVQDQNAVVVDLGVVKADSGRELDAAFDEDAVAANVRQVRPKGARHSSYVSWHYFLGFSMSLMIFCA